MITMQVVLRSDPLHHEGGLSTFYSAGTPQTNNRGVFGGDSVIVLHLRCTKQPLRHMVLPTSSQQ
eukprot:4770195-Amphidinium_carterae.1